MWVRDGCLPVCTTDCLVLDAFSEICSIYQGTPIFQKRHPKLSRMTSRRRLDPLSSQGQPNTRSHGTGHLSKSPPPLHVTSGYLKGNKVSCYKSCKNKNRYCLIQERNKWPSGNQKSCLECGKEHPNLTLFPLWSVGSNSLKSHLWGKGQQPPLLSKQPDWIMCSSLIQPNSSQPVKTGFCFAWLSFSTPPATEVN